MKPVEETEKLLRSLKPEEQTLVRRYFQHTSYFHQCFKRHLAIIEPLEGSDLTHGEAEKIMEKADALLEEINDYITKNHVDDDHEATMATLARYGRRPVFTVISIAATINGNNHVAHKQAKAAGKK
jgi:hypothetical protein